MHSRFSWTAVLLLSAVALGLLAGTLLWAAGPRAAFRYVYDHPWFQAVLGLTAFAALAGVRARSIRSWRGLRFCAIHLGVAVILTGGAISHACKRSGLVELSSGEAARVAVSRNGTSTVDMGFTLVLDRFAVRKAGPAGPEEPVSSVHVAEEPCARAAIAVNAPFRYRGWWVHQFDSGVNERTGGPCSVLLVTRDPGVRVVYAGYLLLVLGMVSVNMGGRMRRLPAQAGPNRDSEPRREDS